MVVFFDLDGTVIDNESQIIPDSAVEAIRLLRKNGHLPIVNTGRPIGHVDPRVREMDFSGWICACGMELLLNGEFVFDLTINTRGVGELDEEQKAYIKNTIADKILYEIDSVLNIAKENKCDFLRLYKVYQSKKRNRFYEIDWQEMIGTMNISTNVLIDKIKNEINSLFLLSENYPDL